MTERPGERDSFLPLISSLEMVDDDDAPILRAVGFLSASLHLTTDAAFNVLQEEAHLAGLDLRAISIELVSFRRALTGTER